MWGCLCHWLVWWILGLQSRSSPAQSSERGMAWQRKSKGIKTNSKSFLTSEQKAYEANRWSRHEGNTWIGQGCCWWPEDNFCIWDVHSRRNQGCSHAETLLCGEEHQRSCQIEENVRVTTTLWVLTRYQNWVTIAQKMQRSIKEKWPNQWWQWTPRAWHMSGNWVTNARTVCRGCPRVRVRVRGPRLPAARMHQARAQEPRWWHVGMAV